MTWQSGGSPPTIPGLSSDGQNGIVVQEGITAGDTTFGSAMVWNGALEIDAISNIDEPTLFLRQFVGSQFFNGNKSVLYIQRGNSDGTPITRPMFTIENVDNASAADALYYFSPDRLHDVQINIHGGLGLFNHPAPAAPRTLAQASIDAIADASAKASVQACANALADMGVLQLT